MTAPMILPPHHSVDGSIEGDRWLGRDARVPRPLRSDTGDYFREEHPPKVVAHYHRTEQCPTGRHLWDVVESTVYRELEDEAGDFRSEEQFRTTMTCVRCGVIRCYEGVRDGDTRHPSPVDPVPMTAGDLAAQQVHREQSYGGEMSTWAVFRGETRVGVLTWDCGPRGRFFHFARLDEWPAGQTVQAPTPAGALRKLARSLRQPLSSTV